MKTMLGWLRRGLLVAGSLALFGAGRVLAQYTSLHEFAGGAGDGAVPYGSLTLSGASMYGMTYHGGVIFKLNADGSGYTNLHSFTGAAGDGMNPYGALTLSGATLYGMTLYGGASNTGVVFAVSLSNTWDAFYQELGGGWRRLSWFGDYLDLGGNWIWHSKHGYEYCYPGSTPTSIYLWDYAGLGWWWTSKTIYPYLYRFSDGVWLWYQSGSGSPRWFFNLNTLQWESHY